jgi:hypothetical protein
MTEKPIEHHELAQLRQNLGAHVFGVLLRKLGWIGCLASTVQLDERFDRL